MGATITHIDIYYFSGTGNALSVANWIRQVAEERQIKVNLYDISKLNSRTGIEVTPNSLIGIISPTHGFNFPPVMFHFLLRFPKAKMNNIFIINTRAGMKMGKLFLPGLSGMAQYFSALLLRLKGYKVAGMFPVDLPSNWISIHPGLKSRVIESIFQKRKEQTKKFANEIINGQSNFRALYDIIQDLLITPVAILYYLVGRFVLAKTFYASQKCNNCNLCVRECPVKAIKLIDNRPYWTFRCESCMHCMNHCPQRAIETAHGYIFSLFLIVDFLFVKWTYQLFEINEHIDQFPLILEKTLSTIIFTVILIVLLPFTYRILHYLLKFKSVEKLMIYSSFTSYQFWRRYKPGKKLK